MKNKLEKTTDLVINILEEIGSLSDIRCIMKYHYRDVIRAEKRRRKESEKLKKERAKFLSSVQYLEKAKFITSQLENGRKSYKLTDKGKLRFLVTKTKQRKDIRSKGKLKHLIIFDIPEAHRKFRTLLRDCLHNLDYVMVQRSCFVSSDRYSHDLLKEIIDSSGLGEYVKIFLIK